MAALWLAGALAVLLRPIVEYWHVRRIARAGVPLTDGPWRAAANDVATRIGLLRTVELRRAAQPVVPMTWGVVRPTVLLPAGAAGWSPTRHRVVLAHELAHVRRWDAATQGLARLALAAFWFGPLVWLAVRRMRAERERACDDLALRTGLRPSEYVGELLACAWAMASAWPSPRVGRVLALCACWRPSRPSSRRASARSSTLNRPARRGRAGRPLRSRARRRPSVPRSPVRALPARPPWPGVRPPGLCSWSDPPAHR